MPPPPAAPPPPVAARRRRWPVILLVIIVVLAGFAIWQGPSIKAQAEAGAGFAARVGCSCRYVQGRDLDSCTTDFMPGMAMISLSEDPATKTVTASAPLLASRSARLAGRSGCLMVPEE